MKYSLTIGTFSLCCYLIMVAQGAAGPSRGSYGSWDVSKPCNFRGNAIVLWSFLKGPPLLSCNRGAENSDDHDEFYHSLILINSARLVWKCTILPESH